MAVEAGFESTIGAADRATFERIYLESFPPSEREPVAALVTAVESGAARFLAARRDRELVGFALTALLGRGVVYLEYLAVERSVRGSGFGTKLMNELRRRANEERAAAIVWEVESPEAGPPQERLLRQRRIRFYERCGGNVVRCAPGYHTPDLTGGAPLDMQLMWLPVQPDAPQPDGELLRWLVETLLTIGYGLDPDDPLVRSNIDRLEC